MQEKENKQTRKILQKESQGITLIALVVTIVVLLILAGVSIIVIFGDSGIITMAQRAAKDTELAVQKQEEQIKEIYKILEEKATTEILAEDIILNKTIINVGLGETLTVGATIKPDNVTNKNITWESGDTSVVEISRDGVIATKKKGVTTIIAKTMDGSDKVAQCKVVVVSSPRYTWYIQWFDEEGNKIKGSEGRFAGSGSMPVSIQSDREVDGYTFVREEYEFLTPNSPEIVINLFFRKN